MGSWHIRASAASITGACVFAVVTGAGAVFVGDWYGSSHHGTVVTEFVTTPASPAHGSHPAVARSTRPAVTGHHTSGGPARSAAQADAQTARVAAASQPAREHHAKQAPAPASAGDGNSRGNSPGDGNGQGNGQGKDSGHQGPGSSPATATATETPTPVASPTSAGTTDGSSGAASTAPLG